MQILTTEEVRDRVKKRFKWRPSTRTVLNWSLNGINGKKLVATKLGPSKVYTDDDVETWLDTIEPLIPMLKRRAARPEKKPAKRKAPAKKRPARSRR